MRSTNNSRFLIVVLLILCITTSNAQENDIKLFGENSKSMQRQSVSNEDEALLQKLVYDNIDSALFLRSDINPIKLSTERIITDITSLPLLNKEKSRTVQVVVIKILDQNELLQTIDYSVFKNFPNLKCVYISCEVKAELPQIIRMIKKDNETKNLTTFLGFNLPQ